MLRDAITINIALSYLDMSEKGISMPDNNSHFMRYAHQIVEPTLLSIHNLSDEDYSIMSRPDNLRDSEYYRNHLEYVETLFMYIQKTLDIINNSKTLLLEPLQLKLTIGMVLSKPTSTLYDPKQINDLIMRESLIKKLIYNHKTTLNAAKEYINIQLANLRLPKI